MRKRIIVAVTGASGVQLGYNVLKALRAQNTEIHLILSEGAKETIHIETKLRLEEFIELADFNYEPCDLAASISSGSYETDGMIVVPCSMKTLSGIVNAYDENLIIRAADVCLKECRKVVLVPREMPLNCAHLRNMSQAAQDGCCVLPPMLSFYMGEFSVEQQMNHVVGKILQQFHLDHQQFVRWQGTEAFIKNE